MRCQLVMPAQQRGVALITVLLVFALATVIAAEMLRRSQLSLRGVGNLLATRQAYYYALGGESYGRQLLAKDVLDGFGAVDHLQETWALTEERPPFPIDNGQMTVEIKDLQGRFNLNSVIGENDDISPAGFAQFQQLLAAMQLNPKYALEWLDWLDRGQVVSTNGAEDADYPNYRTADRAESDVSALRLLRSMTAEDYAKLAPHVTVLPKQMLSTDGVLVAVSTPLNVNTADAVALRAILGEAQVAQVRARQQSGGYKSIDQFPGADADRMAVKSNFFEISVTVVYDGRWQRLRSVIMRDGETGATQVISRTRSPLIDDSVKHSD
jgi:general secretion pathway protein K